MSTYVCFKFGRVLTSNVQGRYAVHLCSSTLNPLARSASGAAVVVGWCVSPEARATCLPPLGNFDTKLPSSYCYELQPEHRLETSLTRTPPPICTSTPFPKPRWSEEPWAPRTLIDVHQALIPATKMIRRGSARNDFAPAKSGNGFCREWQGVESAQRFKMQKRCDISDICPK